MDRPLTNDKPKRVLLIGWDAADWQMMRPLIDAGQMPNTKRFIEEGVSGNVATLTPPLSPMLWTSIVTGKTADKHGILGFAEPDATTGQSRPVTSTGRTCKAIWNILSDHGRPSGAINWFASHPAETIHGFVVTDRFAHPTGPLEADKPYLGWSPVPHTVWPSEDLDALCTVRVHPQMITQEQVLEFIPSATNTESASWEKVRELRSLLAHCTTVHNAATAYINERQWDFMGVYYDAIDRFAHAFMEYYPPRMEHVSKEDFNRYSGVMDACYRFHDLMLGRLMNMVDEDTAVMLLSDHGFHSGATRPRGTSGIVDGQPASWHRPYGIIAVRGPGIKRGEPIYGASLLDVTPTILDMLGMGTARDMDGDALTQIWASDHPNIEQLETYEGEDNPLMHQDSSTGGAAVDEQILHQLRQLGYMGKTDAVAVTIDRARNLASVYQSLGKTERALDEYERILKLDAESPSIRISIAGCLLAIKRVDEAEAQMDLAQGDRPANARQWTIRSMIASARDEHTEALRCLERALELEPTLPGIQTRIAFMHAHLGHHDEAEACFERALEHDPDDAIALEGLGLLYQGAARHDEAVLAFTRSIALQRNRAQTHIHLGDSLVRVDRNDWAVEAYTEATRIAPGNAIAHERIADLFEQRLNEPKKAALHRRHAIMIRAAIRKHTTEQPDPAPRAWSVDEVTQPPVSAPTRAPTTSTPANNGQITIVSGLPRSGTSLMMQMLDAGGIPAMTDRERVADENNPRGYYELEAVKRTAKDPGWLGHATGHAVKVIHALLPVLPADKAYLVIFMKRRLDEVVASQGAMLDQMGREGSSLTGEALRAAYQREYERTGSWLNQANHMRVLEVSYNELLDRPESVIRTINQFLGGELNSERMHRVIDRRLYRQRS